MQTRTNEDVILDLFSAIEERDRERILAIYHPEVEFHWPAALPYGGSSTRLGEPGAPTWQECWLPVQPTAAERSMDCRIIASRGDEVVAVYHQRGRDRCGNVVDDEVMGLSRAASSAVPRCSTPTSMPWSASWPRPKRPVKASDRAIAHAGTE